MILIKGNRVLFAAHYIHAFVDGLQKYCSSPIMIVHKAGYLYRDSVSEFLFTGHYARIKSQSFLFFPAKQAKNEK